MLPLEHQLEHSVLNYKLENEYDHELQLVTRKNKEAITAIANKTKPNKNRKQKQKTRKMFLTNQLTLFCN